MIPQILGVSKTVEPSFQMISNLCVPEDRKRLDALRRNLESLSDERLTYQIRTPDGDLRWLEETINQDAYHKILEVISVLCLDSYISLSASWKIIYDLEVVQINHEECCRVMMSLAKLEGILRQICE